MFISQNHSAVERNSKVKMTLCVVFSYKRLCPVKQQKKDILLCHFLKDRCSGKAV